MRKEIKDARKKFGRYAFVERSHFSKGYMLRFTVGVQTFTMIEGVTKTKADWFKNMLCLALANLVEANSPKGK